MKTQINLPCSGGAPPPSLSPAAITRDTAGTLRPHLAEIQKGQVDLGENSATVSQAPAATVTPMLLPGPQA